MREMQDLLSELETRKAIAWLWDVDRQRIVWATEPTLAFWREPTLLDLIARVFGPEDDTVIQLEQAKSDLVPMNWIKRRLWFHPEHLAVRAICKLRPHQLRDGREGIIVEIEQVENQISDIADFALDALGRHAPIPLALYNVDGTLIAKNEVAEKYLEVDSSTSLDDLVGEENAAANLIVRVLADEVASRTISLKTRYGERLHRITAKRSRHPLTGAPAINVAFEDVEDSRRVWRETKRALQGLTKLPDNLVATATHEENARAPAVTSNVLQFKGPSKDEISNSRSFFEVFPEALFRIDQNGAITFANRLAHEVIAEDNANPLESSLPSLPMGSHFASLFDSNTKNKIEEYISNYEESSAGQIAFNRGCSLAHELVPHGTMNLTIFPAIFEGLPYFFGILQDRTFELEKEENLKQAREDAQNRSRQKSEFIANASHEMRTPLNAIVGFSEIMAKEQMGPLQNDRYSAYARDIHKSSLHLLSLVDDLLDLAKIESGKLDLEISDVNIGSAIEECITLIEPLAKRAKLSLKRDIEHDLPHVAANERSLRQILINVVSNAIKFSMPSKEVKLTAKLDQDGSVVICVHDQGVGMTDADLKVALEPFGQISRGREQHSKIGTGLGLPLAKALAEANHAEFDIISAPGKGTMVQLTFPSTLVLAE